MSFYTKLSGDIVNQIIDTSSDLNLCFNGHCGDEIDALLATSGFELGKPYSICRASSFQSLREINHKRVEIINSNFMGIFTQIKVYTK